MTEKNDLAAKLQALFGGAVLPMLKPPTDRTRPTRRTRGFIPMASEDGTACVSEANIVRDPAFQLPEGKDKDGKPMKPRMLVGDRVYALCGFYDGDPETPGQPDAKRMGVIGMATVVAVRADWSDPTQPALMRRMDFERLLQPLEVVNADLAERMSNDDVRIENPIAADGRLYFPAALLDTPCKWGGAARATDPDAPCFQGMTREEAQEYLASPPQKMVLDGTNALVLTESEYKEKIAEGYEPIHGPDAWEAFIRPISERRDNHNAERLRERMVEAGLPAYEVEAAVAYHKWKAAQIA